MMQIKAKTVVDNTASMHTVQIVPTHHDTAGVIDGLDKTKFLDQLRIEKYRAKRSDTPLSLLMIKLNRPHRAGSGGIRELLKVVATIVREIDIVGYIDHQTLGVLLPYTDEKGASKSIEKIKKGFINPHFIITSATFPNEIFDSLIKSDGASEDVLGLMLEDSIEHSWFALKVKRMIDILGSVFGLIVLSPLMLLTYLLIKLDSPGPVIFKQVRLGEKGLPFTFYKFRSMHANNDPGIHKEYIQKLIKNDGNDSSVNQGDDEKPLYKLKSDPRITRVGRYIRKTSIDELPQLYNVLKGDMSLVGPRPPLVYEVETYKVWHLRRILEMKPGITGLWQVEGRSRTGFDEAVRLDVRYLQSWSLWLDAVILVKTVKEVLQCRGAV